MRKVLIFENSGSGKTTIAKSLCNLAGLSHLEFDTLAWEATIPPERRPIIESDREIWSFIKASTQAIKGMQLLLS
ncbi:MAG: hypothetical protein H6995_00625 [Pseudomonadales bacterium]|nr:hypothetical protein [Pseudomonadales bacterium]MCP5213500.1 hypothetical protein [Pseudomonadales bacterium]